MDVIGGIIYYRDRDFPQHPVAKLSSFHVIEKDSIAVFMSDSLEKDETASLYIEGHSVAGGKWRMDRSPASSN